MPLTTKRLEPATTPRSLVILLHGYGADGQDLLDLGFAWRTQLPDAVFVAPNAPEPCEINPSGFQWWSLADVLNSGITRPLPATGAEAMRPRLTEFIAAELAHYHLDYHQLALVGFSQGAMLALHVGLHLPTLQTPAAIIGYSGCLLDGERLNNTISSKAPTLLVHGLLDPIVPYMLLEPSAAALRTAGVAVETLTCPQLAHGIDDKGLAAGGRFLASHLK